MGAIMMVIITVPFCGYSLLMPLSCNSIWLLHSSFSSLSLACHRSEWNATNSAFWLSGWAKLAQAEEMFVYVTANDSEVWKWKHQSYHTRESGSCFWWDQYSAIWERRQDRGTAAWGSCQAFQLYKSALKGLCPSSFFKKIKWGTC